MKKNILITLAALSVLSQSHSEFSVKIPITDNIKFYKWTEITPIFGDWINQNNSYDCTNWHPSTSTVEIGKSFIQTANDCKQQQTRTVQNRKIDEISGKIDNYGSPYIESRTINITETRNAIGELENWQSISPEYSSWINIDALYNCSTWTPLTSDITIGQEFTQNRNCLQNQTRTRQDREQESTTKEIRNSGGLITESNIITVPQSQSSIGTKETWVAITPTESAWTNSGSPTGCSAWTPDASTGNVGTMVNQSRTCSQAQTRTRQNREQETTTGAIRNTTTSTETTTVTVTQNQQVSGTKPVTECIYSAKPQSGWFYPTPMDPFDNPYVYWNGTFLKNNISTTSFTSGGYLYTRGAQVYTYQYEICRKKV